MRRTIRLAAVSAAALTVLAACGSDPTDTSSDDSDSSSDVVVVGSAGFPESEIIGEIYLQALEAEGIEVSSQFQIGAREAYIPALENGEISVIPEYSGNLLAYFDAESGASTPEEVEAALPDALPDGLEVLDAAPAENKDSLNVTSEFSAENSVTSIADLANLDSVSIAANPEFSERSYGIPGLESVYGIENIDFTAISDGGGPATVAALLNGSVDVANIYSTTPSITENNLVTLDDPENLIAAQNVIPLISSAAASDQVVEILNAVSAELTTDDLLKLNARNQGSDNESPSALATSWLEEKGLI